MPSRWIRATPPPPAKPTHTPPWEDPASAVPFDRRRVIGLHHLALRVAGPEVLEALHRELAARKDVEIEFGPEPLGAPREIIQIGRKKGNDPGDWPQDMRVRQFPRALELEDRP